MFFVVTYSMSYKFYNYRGIINFIVNVQLGGYTLIVVSLKLLGNALCGRAG